MQPSSLNDETDLVDIFEQINRLLHDEEYSKAGKLLLQIHYADLADYLDNTNNKLYPHILPEIIDNIVPETIVCLSNSSKKHILELIGVERTAYLINAMDIEDAIDVVSVLSSDFKDQLLLLVNSDKAGQILEGCDYPKTSVGRIVEKNFIALQEHWTCGQAIDYIRRSGINKDFSAVIVVDNKSKPVGNVILSSLLKNSRNQTLAEFMQKNLRVVDVTTNIDELIFIFKQYELRLVPVVNRTGKLVGIVSVESMVYIIEERTESEFLHLGGIKTVDIFDNLSIIARNRFPWLFVNLITACITSTIIEQFGETIAKLITLATIMPIVASMGGNSGTQAMTVTVRALANREINTANVRKVVLKEVFVCMLNGTLLAIIGYLVSFVLFDNIKLSGVFAVAVIINFTVAGFLGSSIPIVLSRMGLDPATASGVFLTAMTDATGFFSFLGLAYLFL
jgi:magnesium transporter